MSDQEFMTHVESFALKKLVVPNNMFSQFELYWNEIKSHRYNFFSGILILIFK